VKSKDFFSSFFWLLMGIGVSYGGYDLGLGTAGSPGSGYIFFWIGIIMAGLSILVLVQAVRLGPKAGAMKALWSGIRWPQLISVLLSLFLYGLFFNFLGFILSSFLLLLFLFKAVEPQKWSVALLGAVLSALVAYLVFQVWLGSTFPAGLMEKLRGVIWSF
jgi:hypothetical protein